MGQGVYTSMSDDSGRGTRRRFQRGDGWSTRRPTTSSTAIRCSAFRPPATPIRSGRSGCRLRTAGAGARAMLIAGRRASNGRSIRRAARPPNSEVMHTDERAQARLWRPGARASSDRCRRRMSPLKDPKNFTLIGKPLKRLDTPDKVNGKASLRHRRDAARHEVCDAARLVRCSAARSAKVDDSAAKKITGRAADRACSTISSPWSAIICGRPRRASMRWSSTGTKARTRVSTRTISGDDLRAASEKDGAVAKIRRRHRQGPRHRRPARCGLRAAVSRACDDGADELHGPCHARFVRDLDRHAGYRPACSRRRRKRPAFRSRR